MVFGHNSNLKLGNITLHVQTEDRGVAHALLDTTVYYHGRVLHRRTNNYFDLLPLDDDRQQALKLRLEEQHRLVMDEIRSGILDLPIPPEPVALPPKPSAAPAAPPSESSPPALLVIELVNARNWLVGKRASLHVRLKQSTGAIAAGAGVAVEFEGADSEHVFRGQADEHGEAHLEFDLPRIISAEPALVIRAAGDGAEGQLRFALRAKPRVPSV
jgi:hypothetical protein